MERTSSTVKCESGVSQLDSIQQEESLEIGDLDHCASSVCGSTVPAMFWTGVELLLVAGAHQSRATCWLHPRCRIAALFFGACWTSTLPQASSSLWCSSSDRSHFALLH